MPRRITRVRKPATLLGSLKDRRVNGRVVAPFEDVDVLVLGDVVLDRCVYTDRVAERKHKQPLLNVLKHSGSDDQLAAGGAALLARIASAYGANVRLCGAVGVGDEEAGKLRSLLQDPHRRESVRDFRVIDSGSDSTATVTRFYAREAPDRYVEHVRIDRETDLPQSVKKKVVEGIIETMGQLLDDELPDAVLLGDFARGVICPEVTESLSEVLRARSVPIVALDGKRCWETLLKIDLTLVVLSVDEAWSALKDVNREKWERRLARLEYPPTWSKPTDCKDFVEVLMDTFPRVWRFLINDPLGSLLAVQRDKRLHGLYSYALIKPPSQFQVLSPVGSESMLTAIATLCLSTTDRSPVFWDDFFCAAYAARNVSCVQLGTRAEDIADPTVLGERLAEQSRSGWPDIPRGPARPDGPSIWEVRSEREVKLQTAVESLDSRLVLRKAQTGIPDLFTTCREFRDGLHKAVAKLGKRAAKPIRLWIHGDPGSGKEFVARKVIEQVWQLRGLNIRKPFRQVQPDELNAEGFSLVSVFEEAQNERRALILNEIDKAVPPWMRAQLLTLLDDEKKNYADVLVVGIASVSPRLLAQALKEERDPCNLGLPDLVRRFHDKRRDAAEIDIPPFRERLEDLPYLLAGCLLRHADGRPLPDAFSKSALELLVRMPDLLASREEMPREITFTDLNYAAERILQWSSKKRGKAAVDARLMASALRLRKEERQTVFYRDDEPTVAIDLKLPP